jgi:cell division protein ZapB
MSLPDKSILLETEIGRIEHLVEQLCHEVQSLRQENKKLKEELVKTQEKSAQLEQKLNLAKTRIAALLKSIPEHIDD